MRTRELAAALETPKRAPGPLRRDEITVALTMKAENKTADQIAVALGAHPNTIAAFFRRYTDTSAVALARLRAGAASAADDWMKASRIAAKQGDHKPARDLLAGVGVIRDKPVIGQQVVIVGTGAGPIGEDPWAPPAPADPLRLPAKDQGPDDIVAELMADDDIQGS